MIDCAGAELLLAARAARALAATDAEALTAHLASCDGCRAVGVSLAPTDDDAGDGALAIVDPADYQLGAELARGGMGRILLAHDLRIGREVAIKELTHRTPALAARFEREARLTARLQHPGIVPIYEIGAWPDGTPFYAMRLVRGGTLGDAIARATTTAEGRRLIPSVITACEAVGFAHDRGVIHRDLTPANVLRGDHGETVVIDWGLAKPIGDDDRGDDDVGPYRAPSDPTRTAAGAVLGTVAYMAPEQARGEPVDARADVYALGAILHHVLTGTPPFAGAPDDVLAAVRAGARPRRAIDAPRDLVSVVDKAMAPTASDRYPDAGELAGELRRFHDGLLVAAHTYSWRERAGRWLRRHRMAMTMAVAALIALAIVSGVAVERVIRERDRANRSEARLRLTLAHELMKRAREAAIAGDRDEAAQLLLRARESSEFDPDAERLVGRVFAGRTPVIASEQPIEQRTVATVALRPGSQDAVVAFNGAQLELRRVDTRTGAQAPMVVPWTAPEYGNHSPWAPTIMYTADARLVLVAVDDHVGVWDASDGVLRATWNVEGTIELVPGAAETFEFGDTWWRRRDAATGRVLAEGALHDRYPEALLSGDRILHTGEHDLEIVTLATDRVDARIPLAQVDGGASIVDDGHALVGCSRDGVVRRWSTDGQERARFDTGRRALRDCAWSADGRRMVAVVEDVTDLRQRLVVWSTTDGWATLRVFEGGDGSYINPWIDGDRILVRMSDAIVLFDVATGTRSSYLAYEADLDGTRLALVSSTWHEKQTPGWSQSWGHGLVRVVDLDATGPTARYATAEHGIARVLATADEGHRGLGTATAGGLAIWDRVRGTTRLPNLGEPAVMTRDGHHFAAWAPTGAVVVTDGTGAVVRTIEQPTAPRSLALSPGGTQLAIVGADGVARRVTLASGQAIAIPDGGVVTGAAVDDDGHVLVCRGIARNAWLWTAGAAAPVDTEDEGNRSCVDGLGVFGRVLVGRRPDGEGVAADRDGQLTPIFGADAMDRRGIYAGGTDRRLVRLDDVRGRTIGVSSSDFPDITRWPVPLAIEFVATEAGPVGPIALSLDALLIATSRGLWTFNGTLLVRLDFPRPPVHLSFSADGDQLTAVDATGEVTIWDIGRDRRGADALRPLLPPLPR